VATVIKLFLAETHPVTTQQHPATAQQHPVLTQQHPVATQQHPVTTQQHPAPSQQHPVSTQQHPAPNQQHPVSTQQHPATTQQHSVPALLPMAVYIFQMMQQPQFHITMAQLIILPIPLLWTGFIIQQRHRNPSIRTESCTCFPHRTLSSAMPIKQSIQ
jgi:hypothetical protein